MSGLSQSRRHHSPALWGKAFSLAKYNGANVDLGHFVAGNSTRHQSRSSRKYITNVSRMCISRTGRMHDGPNTPFGEGDTPMNDVLHLLQDASEHRTTIEF